MPRIIFIITYTGNFPWYFPYLFIPAVIIRAFMTDELLNEYDVISARHDYLTGCFALYRNQPYFRELFKQSKDYRKVFTDSRNCLIV